MNLRQTFLLLICVLSFQQSIHAQKRTEPEIVISIFFGGGSYYVDLAQTEKLFQLIDDIENLEHYAIYIHGHTDNIGSVEYNQWLSDMRTDSVIQKMMTKGIGRELINQWDFGELNPVFDNSTWEGKLKNRRVDIIFKKLES